MPWHPIALPHPLASGEKAIAKIKDLEILVCRVDEDYYAVASRCTHAAWQLLSEPIEGTDIICTLHGSRFDLRDGCPTAGPAHKPLTTYPIELRHGELYVSLQR